MSILVGMECDRPPHHNPKSKSAIASLLSPISRERSSFPCLTSRDRSSEKT
ncbi:MULTISPECIES: hypothetical protein [unclassified Microcoleus]|uniref:hypothetical protein n=1 Tax=unclassified Microcoleus TaxID=2642155 RepID=UPI002FD0DC9B